MTQHLTFSCSGERFALELARVRQILEYRPLRNVPLMPDFVRGVFSLRGEVIPVLDCAGRLGLPLEEPGRRACIALVETRYEGYTTVGLLVGQVNEVVEVDPTTLTPPPAFGSKVRREFLAGLATIPGGECLVVLDVARLLAPDEVAALIGQRLAA